MSTAHFLKPTRAERALNKLVGLLARAGLCPGYIHVLQVEGRRTGKVYSTAVNLLQVDGRQYLVGGRGHTNWSRNASTVGRVTLVRGRWSRQFRVRALSDNEKPKILKAYLETYRYTVQRFFAVQAGSPVEAFRAIAERHPVFELL